MRNKQKWQHQAIHSVSHLDELLPPVAVFHYRKPWGKDAAESIYLFDQEAAKSGIAYYAEYGAGFRRWRAFTIWVCETDNNAAQQIIERLNPSLEPRLTARFSGSWTEIEPTRLSKAHKDHPWTFAVYRESSSQRDDSLKYVAFLFRNEERTIFGIKEWLGLDVMVRNDVLEKMAHRVVVDAAFRRNQVSDDPELPLLWKRR
jgi:hypothetical protein